MLKRTCPPSTASTSHALAAFGPRAVLPEGNDHAGLVEAHVGALRARPLRRFVDNQILFRAELASGAQARADFAGHHMVFRPGRSHAQHVLTGQGAAHVISGSLAQVVRLPFLDPAEPIQLLEPRRRLALRHRAHGQVVVGLASGGARP